MIVPITEGLELCDGEQSGKREEVSDEKLIPTSQNQFSFQVIQTSAIMSV